MQTVLLFAAKAFTAAKGAMAAAGAAGAAGGGAGSGLLGALRVGTSAVSALSQFGQSRAQASAMKREAADEEMAARQGLTQSQEQANSLQRDYNKLVQQQLTVASGYGIDLGSGSVAEAREAAQTDVDRQMSISRNGADMNASLRRSRASTLRYNAKLTKEAGALSALATFGGGVLDARKAG